MSDEIKNPPHYPRTAHDWCDVAEDWKLPGRLWNVLKYLRRYQLKGKPVRDLKKAAQYIEMEIQAMGKRAVRKEEIYIPANPANPAYLQDLPSIQHPGCPCGVHSPQGYRTKEGKTVDTMTDIVKGMVPPFWYGSHLCRSCGQYGLHACPADRDNGWPLSLMKEPPECSQCQKVPTDGVYIYKKLNFYGKPLFQCSACAKTQCEACGETRGWHKSDCKNKSYVDVKSKPQKVRVEPESVRPFSREERSAWNIALDIAVENIMQRFDTQFANLHHVRDQKKKDEFRNFLRAYLTELIGQPWPPTSGSIPSPHPSHVQAERRPGESGQDGR